jgi:hypothetical protein
MGTHGVEQFGPHVDLTNEEFHMRPGLVFEESGGLAATRTPDLYRVKVAL